MSDTPKTDANAGWFVSNRGIIRSDGLFTQNDGPFVHASFARELERENAALREALASAENGLRHGLMMEPVDPFQRGKVISVALDTVRAALKKEAQP